MLGWREPELKGRGRNTQREEKREGRGRAREFVERASERRPLAQSKVENRVRLVVG